MIQVTPGIAIVRKQDMKIFHREQIPQLSP